jgi:plastocyanin
MNVGYLAKQDPMIEFMRFGNSNLKIREGDSVEWVQASQSPHTVTFLNGFPEPEVLIPTTYPGTQQPTLMFNFLALIGMGGQVYDSSRIFSSGAFSPLGQITSYTLTFNHAGKYDYLCLFHDQMGMVGNITVGSEHES